MPSLARHLAGHARQWDLLLVIAAGGALGSLARWALTLILPVAPDVPWATLTANGAGAMLLGGLMVAVERRRGHRWLRPFLGIGVLGGFTTFSTYVLDARALAAGGRWGVAALYVVGSVMLGLAATMVGLLLARALTREPRPVGGDR